MPNFTSRFPTKTVFQQHSADATLHHFFDNNRHGAGTQIRNLLDYTSQKFIPEALESTIELLVALTARLRSDLRHRSCTCIKWVANLEPVNVLRFFVLELQATVVRRQVSRQTNGHFRTA